MTVSKKTTRAHSTHETTTSPSPEVSATTTPAAAAPPITPPGDLPPATGAPATPKGWVPATKKRGGPIGLRPKTTQIANAVSAAKELASSTTYENDFGTRAPPAAQIAYVVTNAAKWRDLWQGAKAFFAYASEQRAVWENDALTQMDALKPAYEYAASREAGVADKYAATGKFLGATNAIAARAATSRKAKTKAGKAKESTPAAAAAPVDGSAPAQAAAGKAPTP